MTLGDHPDVARAMLAQHDRPRRDRLVAEQIRAPYATPRSAAGAFAEIQRERAALPLAACERWSSRFERRAARLGQHDRPPALSVDAGAVVIQRLRRNPASRRLR
jgi:hypothetical protein